MLRLLRNASDDRAIRRVLGGDGDAFGVLINRYGQAAFAVARAIAPRESDADDVLQEALILAYRKLDTLQQPQRFGPWLISITRNVALRARERFRETLALDAVPESSLAVSPEVERAEMRSAVREALDRLETDAREVLLMHYFAGASVNDIAEMLNISDAAVKKRLQRAREALGSDLLRTLGRGPEKEAWTLDAKRRKQLLGAVLASGAAWQGKAFAATAAGIGALSLALKAAVAVGVVGAVATAALLLDNNASQAPTATTASATADGDVSQATLAATDDPNVAVDAANAVDAAADAPLPTGPYTVGTTLRTLDGTPLAGAAVVLERVTWKANELPPAKVDTWITYADDAGVVRIENLPAGEYSMIFYTQTLGGGAGFDVSEREPEDISSESLVYPIHAWTGQVVDAAGKPVKYAAIYPIAHESDMNDTFEHWQIAATRAISDEEGYFGFARMWPGNLRFYVYAEGYAPLTTAWTPTSGEGRFVLSQGGGLTLVVTREDDGAPVADATLTLYEQASGSFSPPIEGKTDAQGRLTHEGISAGDYTVIMKDAALLLPEAASAKVEDGKHNTVTLRAMTGATVMGTVRNAEDNAPLPGLVVLAQGDTEREAVTAEDGSFMLVGVRPGSATISVSGRAGDSRRQYPGGVEGFGDGPETYQQLSLAPGETREGLEFALKPSLTFKGVVLGVNGQPVPDAKVIVKHSECTDGQRVGNITTGSGRDGHFTVDLASYCAHALMASHADGMSRLVPVSAADAGTDIVLQLEASLGVRLAGNATMPDGSPIPEGWVNLTYADGLLLTANIRDGQVDFGRVPTGAARYNIQAQTSDNMFIVCNHEPTAINITQPREDMYFPCGKAGDLSIAGMVLLPDGKPAAGATVETADHLHTVKTDAQGRFTLEHLADESYQLNASLPGYRRTEHTQVHAGDNDVVLQLEPMQTLKGRVVDDETDLPVAANVTLTVLTQSTATEYRSTTDAEGRFTFEGIASNDYYLTTTATGYATNRWHPYRGALAPDAELQIRLRRPVQLAGNVVNADGQPVEGAKVIVDTPYTEVKTQADGRFVIHAMEAGIDVRLHAAHDAHGLKTLRVTAGAPGSDNLRIQLEGNAGIELYVTQGGRPLTRYNVHLNPMGPDTQAHPLNATVEDPGGHYTNASLVAGNWQIMVYGADAANDAGSGHTNVSRRVTLVADETIRIDLELEAGNARIEGTVTDEAGNPLENAHAIARQSDGDTDVTQVVPIKDGRFAMEALPPGRYAITVASFNGNSMNRSVDIGAGETAQLDFTLRGGASLNLGHGGDARYGYSIVLNTGAAPHSFAPFAAPPEDGSNLYTASLGPGPTTARIDSIAPGEYWMSVVQLDPETLASATPEPQVQRVTIVPGENQILVGE